MDRRTHDRRVLWLAGLGHAMSHSWELLFPALVVPMAAEMGMPYADAITLSFLGYLLFGVGAVPAGLLTDRYGGRPVLLACLILGGIAGCMVALSYSTTWLVLSLGALGLAASLYHPAGLALLSHEFSGGLGRAFAINGIAGNVGIAATPFIAGLAGSLFGWRWAYAILCAPALVAGLVFLMLPFQERTRHEATGTDGLDASPGFRIAPLLLLAAAVTFGGIAYRLHILVVPALLQDRMPELTASVAAKAPDFLQNVENLTATALTSVAYAMGMVGQWLGGRVADRRPLAPSYLLFHFAGIPFVLAAAFVGGLWILPLLIGFLVFAQGMQPIENSLISKLVPPAWRGRVFAGKFLLAFGMGSTGVWLVAIITPAFGLGGPLVAAAGFEGLIVLVAFVLWRRMRG